MPYSIGEPDTRDTTAVIDAISEIFHSTYPASEPQLLGSLFEDVNEMFSGNYKHYGEVTTEYHNREHTFQAALCVARLMQGRQQSAEQPQLESHHFLLGLTGALLHDIGYLKEETDTTGTGAKYTLEHERRSAAMARVYLAEQGWPATDVECVANIILCTGPRSQLKSLTWKDPMERFLACAVCSADYLGQMADPRYREKLPLLFNEFNESDNFLEIPHEDRLFTSVEDLVAKTPAFWEYVRSKVLVQDCDGVYHYLQRPVSSVPATNPYLETVEANIQAIRQELAQA